jgi:hypothetical protein
MDQIEWDAANKAHIAERRGIGFRALSNASSSSDFMRSGRRDDE